MSRIGKQPIPIPEKVKVDIQGHTVSVDGPKGKITKSFAPVVTITQKEQEIIVEKSEDTRFSRAMFGTARSIIAGMVKGASEGFFKEIEIKGVGFRAVLKGNKIDLALGYSHEIIMDVPEGIVVTITDQTKVKIEGADKQLVGAVTAEMRSYYPPEPYKGKGVHVVGDYVRRKEGKTVA